MSERQIQVELSDYVHHYRECLTAVDALKEELDKHDEAMQAYSDRLAENEAREKFNEKFQKARYYRSPEGVKNFYRYDLHSAFRYKLEQHQDYWPWDHQRRWTGEKPWFFQQDYHNIRNELLQRVKSTSGLNEGKIILSEAAAAEYARVKRGVVFRKAQEAVHEYAKKAAGPLPDLVPLLEDTESLDPIPRPETPQQASIRVNNEANLKYPPPSDNETTSVWIMIGIVLLGAVLWLTR